MKKFFIFLFILFAGLFVVFFYQTKEGGGNQIILEDKEHIIKEDFYVPKRKVLIISPGAHLKMGIGSQIIVDGKIIAKGTEEKPIVFSGYNGYWRGIKINGDGKDLDLGLYKDALKNEKLEETEILEALEDGNVFKNCIFENLATNQIRDVSNRKRAVIESVGSSLVVSDSKFEDIVHMGTIQTDNSFLLVKNSDFLSRLTMKVIHPINSIALIYNNLITPKRYEYQTWPDGIFVNIGIGIVVNNIFDGLSDDAIDFDGSLAYIFGNNIKKTFDDGIDIDNKTEAYLLDNNIESVKEGGILISNQSKAFIVNNNIEKAEHGIVLRNGGWAVADRLSINESNVGILMYQGIPLILTEKDFQNIKKEISSITKEQMNEIGIYEVSSPQGLESLLEEMYKLYDNQRILNNSIEQSNSYFGLFLFLKKMLKFVEVLELSDSDYDMLDKFYLNNNFLTRYNNNLYIKNSVIENAEQGFIFKKPYYFNSEGLQINKVKQNIKKGENINNFDFNNKEIKSIIKKKIYIDNLIKKINLTI